MSLCVILLSVSCQESDRLNEACANRTTQVSSKRLAALAENLRDVIKELREQADSGRTINATTVDRAADSLSLIASNLDNEVEGRCI